MRLLLLLGSAAVQAGPFPSGTLVQSNEWEKYEQPFWSEWSNDYGCPADISPMSHLNNAVDAHSRFCRIFSSTPFTEVLEAISWKICTLPSLTSDGPFKYSADPPVNKFFNVYGNYNRDLVSVRNIQKDTTFFNTMSQSNTDWSGQKPPPGDGDELLLWTSADFSALYTNAERRFIYDTLGAIHSDREACDVRLTITAEYCYDGMFDDVTGYDVYGKFCDEFTLQQIKDKCDAAGCEAPAITSDPVNKGDGKDFIVEGLVLLIEDAIKAENDKWTAYIPSPYKKVLFKKGTCITKCPQPTNWSSWSCWCPNDGVPNDLNLPECKCKEQTRRRIQGCTTVDVDNNNKISCEIYSQETTGDENNKDFTYGLDNYAVCDKYGNDAILGVAGNGVTVNGAGRPVYTRNTGTAYQTTMTYMSQYTDATYKAELIDTNATNTCTNTNTHPELTDNAWRLGDFSYAVEEGQCQIAAVEMRATDGTCSKTCGCGVKTRTHTCHFSDGARQGQIVPTDAPEYECCEEKADEQIACAMNCCPEWHQCNPNGGLTCATDSQFTPGTSYIFKNCVKSCGDETHAAGLRCGCTNQCNYDSSVVIETVVPSGFSRHQRAICDAIAQPNAGDATVVEGAVGTPNQAVTTSEPGDADYDQVVYQLSATQSCNNQCCVTIQAQNVACPALDCYSASKDKPWFLTVTKSPKTLADGSEIFTCSPGAPIYKSSRVCACDVTSTVATCTDSGTTYQLNENVPDSNVQETCEYKRKDYINYNAALANINGKGNEDDYFCCTEEIERDLFTEWATWGECKQSPSKNNECGCASDPDDRCGMQTRKRRAKCDGDHKVDDTTCPCIQSRKCDLPLCPVNIPKLSSPICEFNAARATKSVSYEVAQCQQQSSDFTVNAFGILTDQTTSVNQLTSPDNTCGFCPCNGAVTSRQATVTCGRFDYTCDAHGVDHLIWQEWSTCTPTTGQCGTGIRTRTRQCDGFFSTDDIEAHCYNPTVLRTGETLAMKDNVNYYGSETCYIACPDDFVEYTPWTECSVKFGKGFQMREVVGGDKIETRPCNGELQSPKTGRAAPVYTECDATCGDGTRKKMTMNYDTLRFEVVDEPCKVQDCVAPAALVCPAIGKDLDSVVNGDSTSDNENDTNNDNNNVNNNNSQANDANNNENNSGNNLAPSLPDNVVPENNNNATIAEEPVNQANNETQSTGNNNSQDTPSSNDNTDTSNTNTADNDVANNTNNNNDTLNDGQVNNEDNGGGAVTPIVTTAAPVGSTLAQVTQVNQQASSIAATTASAKQLTIGLLGALVFIIA